MGSRALFLAILLFAIPRPPHAASLDPLQTEDAVLLPGGRLEITLGGQGRLGGRPPFESHDRDEWSAPYLSVRAGLGSRAEAQLFWEALSADFGGSERPTEYGTGDARLFTKVRVVSQGEMLSSWLPATALHFGLKLPNASRASGLGTDEADLFGNVLFSEDFGSGWRAIANAGIGILGNPGRTGGQDDVFVWSGAAVSPAFRKWPDASVQWYAEASGTEGGRFDNERARAVAGLRLIRDALVFFFAGGAGLDDRSGDAIVRFGILWAFDVGEE